MAAVVRASGMTRRQFAFVVIAVFAISAIVVAVYHYRSRIMASVRRVM